MTEFRAGLLLLSLVLAGCDQSANRAAGDSAAAAIPEPAEALPEPADSHDHAGGEGEALLPIMQRLGSHMTALTHALMTDNFDAVTTSAAAIADHAPISAEELERIGGLLGDEMAVFVAVDESVHVAAVRLHDAARAGSVDSIVDRLGAVQRGCVSCHAQFRARLRSGNAVP